MMGKEDKALKWSYLGVMVYRTSTYLLTSTMIDSMEEAWEGQVSLISVLGLFLVLIRSFEGS